MTTQDACANAAIDGAGLTAPRALVTTNQAMIAAHARMATRTTRAATKHAPR